MDKKKPTEDYDIIEVTESWEEIIEWEEEEKEKLSIDNVKEDNPKIAAFEKVKLEAKLRGKDRGCVNYVLTMVFQTEENKNIVMEKLKDSGFEIAYGWFVCGEEVANKLLGLSLTMPEGLKYPKNEVENSLEEITLD